VKLLILGGTVFLGRHIVDAALKRGHEVTIFSRGTSTPKGAIAGVEHLIGNRDGNLNSLLGRTWDAVIDTSGYVPRIVRQSAEALQGSVGHYTFISSISVYQNLSTPGTDESSTVLELEDPASEDVQSHYGALKVLCERVIQEVYPGNSLIIRPGLIVGPYDKTDRFTYWPVRVAKGGQVLAPGDPHRQIQVIDARDLAAWIMRMVEIQGTGLFNATGPEEPLTMGNLLEACKSVSGSDAELVWVPDEFLVEQQVGEWMELPLWIADENFRAMMQVNVDRAVQHGLTFRPVEQTIRDTLAWDATRPTDLGRRAGLGPEREQAVLAAWLNRQR
jgi:2'-hydroxyisoflavone reductase